MSGDLYQILGAAPDADDAVIAAAYRALAKKYHPDTGTQTGTASAERFRDIQDAYDILGNPEARRRYDAQRARLRRQEAEAQPPAAEPSRFAASVATGIRLDTPPPAAGHRPPHRPPEAAKAGPGAPVIAAVILLLGGAAGGAWWMLAEPSAKPAAAVKSAAEAPQTVVPKGSTVPEQIFRNADAPIFGTSDYVLVPGGTRVDGTALAE